MIQYFSRRSSSSSNYSNNNNNWRQKLLPLPAATPKNFAAGTTNPAKLHAKSKYTKRTNRQTDGQKGGRTGQTDWQAYKYVWTVEMTSRYTHTHSHTHIRTRTHTHPKHSHNLYIYFWRVSCGLEWLKYAWQHRGREADTQAGEGEENKHKS